MAEWHTVFPQYNLIENQGYSTPGHKRALREHGPTFLHRYSFGPVRASSPEVRWKGYREVTDYREVTGYRETVTRAATGSNAGNGAQR